MRKKKTITTYTEGMKSRTDWARVDAMKDEDIDFSDIPLQNPEDWKNAKIVRFKIKKKQPVTMRLDDDIIAWFKERTQSNGFRGYQTYINAVLRSFMSRNQKRGKA